MSERLLFLEFLQILYLIGQTLQVHAPNIRKPLRKTGGCHALLNNSERRVVMVGLDKPSTNLKCFKFLEESAVPQHLFLSIISFLLVIKVVQFVLCGDELLPSFVHPSHNILVLRTGLRQRTFYSVQFLKVSEERVG